MRVAWILLFASGCLGEAAVSYQGAVVEGEASAYAFAAGPPAGTPVVGATVELCVNGCGDNRVLTDDNGLYPPLEVGFGGFPGVDTPIEIHVTAPDGRTFGYRTIFEDTDDPTTANPSCEEPCPPVYLNFWLAP